MHHAALITSLNRDASRRGTGASTGHPGVMAFESGRITVPVATLNFHEHFSDSIMPVSSRFSRNLHVFFCEFTHESCFD
jgi:hypothetical protein